MEPLKHGRSRREGGAYGRGRGSGRAGGLGAELLAGPPVDGAVRSGQVPVEVDGGPREALDQDAFNRGCGGGQVLEAASHRGAERLDIVHQQGWAVTGWKGDTGRSRGLLEPLSVGARVPIIVPREAGPMSNSCVSQGVSTTVAVAANVHEPDRERAEGADKRSRFR